MHEFKDKCKFVKENCEDEEVGYFDYLGLYYCRLEKFPMVSLMIMAGWLVMLFTVRPVSAHRATDAPISFEVGEPYAKLTCSRHLVLRRATSSVSIFPPSQIFWGCPKVWCVASGASSIPHFS